LWNNMENHIFSLFNLPFFHIVQSISYHCSTCLSSIFPYHFTFQLTFLPYFHIISQFPSIFSTSFHYSTYFSPVIWKPSWIVKRYGKCGRKVGGIVKWYGKYGRKVSSNVKWYGKYGRSPSWIVKRYGFNLLFFHIFISFHNFLLYFPHLFTIQLTFLP
jgi:hypothetical protein